MENKIYLRRKNLVFVETLVIQRRLNKSQIASLNKNLEPLGYTMSPELMQRVSTLGTSGAYNFISSLANWCKELRGVMHYTPMYPNFPEQVMNATDAELYLNALLHYFSVAVADVTGIREIEWMPEYETSPRKRLTDKVKLEVIGLGSEGDFQSIFANLMNSATSISEQDRDDLEWYMSSPDFRLPESFRSKEIMAFVCGKVMTTVDVSSHVKTATDVLRLAVSLSGGDVSLAKNTKFRNFKRAERRQLLHLLNNAGNITEDMLRYRLMWVRLGERLHPSEYKFNRANEGFDVVRNDTRFRTFDSKVELMFSEGNSHGLVSTLSLRPGVFARNLDRLLRQYPYKYVLKAFDEVARSVSTPVLLQVMAHFGGRDSHSDIRVFFPKGNTAKAKSIPWKLEGISRDICLQVSDMCREALEDKFSELPELGKVYVDPALKNYLVPFSQRSASKSLRSIVRGSTIPLENSGDTARFFLWWNEKGGERIDVDLSASMYNDKWEYIDAVAYYNLRGAGYQAYHSGDITSAPRGACEFIDVDMPSVEKFGGRYIVMTVNSYTRQKFSEMPECEAGWMIRKNPNSGEIFEPKTVVDRFTVSSESVMCAPLILDVVERKMIWIDMTINANMIYGGNNVHSNRASLSIIGKAMTNLHKPTLYDLFTIHGSGRGTLVKDPSRADVVYTVENGLPNVSMDEIVGKYL